MLVHFQYKPLSVHGRKQKWSFSCYFEGRFVAGTYHYDGSILWQNAPHDINKQLQLEKSIHDLMLYHVYEAEQHIKSF
ncbi:YheE family protein [Shouchella rhizosphaerae]